MWNRSDTHLLRRLTNRGVVVMMTVASQVIVATVAFGMGINKVDVVPMHTFTLKRLHFHSLRASCVRRWRQAWAPRTGFRYKFQSGRVQAVR